MSNTNTARITIGDTYATVVFTKMTEAALKDALKALPWIKWQKRVEEEKTKWYLYVDLSDRETDRDEENMTRLQRFVILLEKNDIECYFRSYKETDYSDDSNKYVWKKNSTKKYFLWMQPSYYEKLRDLASEKGMSFSQLIVCATDEYMRREKSVRDCGGIPTIEPIGKPTYVVNSFSEQIRMEMARIQTKPAWIADKLDMPRSRFYSKLDSNNWSDEEKEKIRNYLGF